MVEIRSSSLRQYLFLICPQSVSRSLSFALSLLQWGKIDSVIGRLSVEECNVWECGERSCPCYMLFCSKCAAGWTRTLPFFRTVTGGGGASAAADSEIFDSVPSGSVLRHVKKWCGQTPHTYSPPVGQETVLSVVYLAIHSPLPWNSLQIRISSVVDQALLKNLWRKLPC